MKMRALLCMTVLLAGCDAVQGGLDAAVYYGGRALKRSYPIEEVCARARTLWERDPEWRNSDQATRAIIELEYVIRSDVNDCVDTRKLQLKVGEEERRFRPLREAIKLRAERERWLHAYDSCVMESGTVQGAQACIRKAAEEAKAKAAAGKS